MVCKVNAWNKAMRQCRDERWSMVWRESGNSETKGYQRVTMAGRRRRVAKDSETLRTEPRYATVGNPPGLTDSACIDTVRWRKEV